MKLSTYNTIVNLVKNNSQPSNTIVNTETHLSTQ